MKHVEIQECKTCLIRKQCIYSNEGGRHSIYTCDYCTKQCNIPTRERFPNVLCSQKNNTCLFQMKPDCTF